MDYRVCFADIGQKLVTESLTLAGSFDEAGYIDNLHSGGYHAAGLAHLHELVEAFVRNGYHAYVRLYGAEREVGRLSLGV